MTATVTLTDDDKSTMGDPDDKDSGELSITGPTGNVSEGEQRDVHRHVLEGHSPRKCTVAWSAPLGTDAAVAGGPGDYVGDCDLPGELVRRGLRRDITIAATDDMLSETAESFTVTLGAITSTL